ncbi:hypothetical protein GCM10020358_60070 [Amorphoplanes nipponensis]|uniref:Uncharacterized protein n=1 Tax=Actinoplanes nipponensis TaxID=135950 RepID=A0A919MRQ1_9ACTN|nr:hypothetical protein [Actinoplanes nipponensis]GIE47180.1 hypothetical protein Ani05nite_07140 [Actinoplanes nipponensis]
MTVQQQPRPHGTGLGEVLEKVFARWGFRPCGGCERRARALDRMVTFRARSDMPAPRSGCWFAGTTCYGFIQVLKFCCNDGTEYTQRWGWCIGAWAAPPCRFGPDGPNGPN